MKKTVFKVLSATLLLTAIAAPSIQAANYKFNFDDTSGLMFNNHAYTGEAWKVTDDEDPVVKVDHLDSGFKPNSYMVNLEGAVRSSSQIIKTTGKYSFTNQGGKGGFRYKLKFDENPISSFSSFNIRGSWNPDTY